MTEQLTPGLEDQQAARAVGRHHAEMASTLTMMVEALTAAARERHQQQADDARDELVTWCREQLVPHAVAEESTMYAAAAGMVEARLLIEAMLAEHQAIISLVSELAETADPVDAACLGRALRELFAVHLAKEDRQVLPLLVASPRVSVAQLLNGMHELLGEHSIAASA